MFILTDFVGFLSNSKWWRNIGNLVQLVEVQIFLRCYLEEEKVLQPSVAFNSIIAAVEQVHARCASLKTEIAPKYSENYLNNREIEKINREKYVFALYNNNKSLKIIVEYFILKRKTNASNKYLLLILIVTEKWFGYRLKIFLDTIISVKECSGILLQFQE